MTDSWKPTNRMIDDTILFDAIGKIRESSDKRREIEARVLAENNLASVRQLSEDKKKQFCAIVDAILAEQADVDTQLFADNQHLAEAASKIKVTPWTKQDNNPEKNSTFMGAPKTNPNKGGYAGGAKAEKTKNGYTAMKRIKEEEEGLGEGLIKKVVRAVAGREIANDRTRKTGISAYSSQNKAFAPGTSEADRGKHLAASKPRMKAYKKYDAISRGQKAPGGFGTRKEDLEEMYLDIENFVLESEGLDSIDRLNEQGQEKLAAVVEAVMEGILAEESDDLQELSPEFLRHAANKANQKGNVRAWDKGHKDPEVRARWEQSRKFAFAASSKEDAATSKSIPGFRKQMASTKKLKKEETVEEGWFSGKKSPTPNPKGAPRGERDPGDYKNPTGWANKDVDQATRIARKQMKLKGARKIPHEAW